MTLALWLVATAIYVRYGDIFITAILSLLALAPLIYGSARPDDQAIDSQASDQKSDQNAQIPLILGQTLDPLDIGFMVFDDADRLVYVNEAARKTFPKARDSMTPGATFVTILRTGVNRGAVPAADGDREAWIASRMARHLNPTGPFAMVLEDGAHVQGQEFLLQNNGIAAVYVPTISEETEAKADAVLNEALNVLPQALALFDDHQNLIQANSRFKELFPTFSSIIIPGMRFEDLATAMARSGLITEAIGREEQWVTTRCAQFSKADGAWRDMTIGARSLRISETALNSGGVVLMHNDVTDWVKTEKELLQAKDTAELADRAKSEFLANMSHELRTPLNAVIGFSEVLRDKLFGPLGGERYYDFVNDIHDSGEHLLELIDDILDLSKMEVGQRELDAKPMDLSRTIIAAVRMVNQRAERAGVSVRVDTEEDMPPFNGEERGIKQILLNLLTNAIKFTPANGEITVITHMSADGALVITISDTGIGMARSEIPLAFAPFVQLDSAHSRQYEGTGLGLPLVKSLVEMHGGSVRIDSEIDQGTSVVLRFPNSSMVREADTGH